MTEFSSRRRRTIGQIFAVPLLLALATLVGLVVGLTGGGTRDLLAWLLLILPLAAIAWAWARRS